MNRRRSLTDLPPALTLAAGAVQALLALAILGTIGAVLWRAGALTALTAADLRAVRFTVTQAALSALISVALAIPLARALSRRRFPGRRAMITALGAPFLLPVIVAVFGLLALFGRAGLVNLGLGALGVPRIDIYGLQGILIAHVFLNLPLATRLILQGWAGLPAESFRLAASLDLPDRTLFRAVELPMLRGVVPGALVTVFLICLTSFAVVLALGGGPRATTIELAIYQAFRFEFDLGKAAVLALVQVGLGMLAAMLALAVGRPEPGHGLDRQVRRGDGGGWRRAVDVALIALAAVFVLAPILAVALRGASALADWPPGLTGPALRSVAVAAGATALVAATALPLALRIGAGAGSLGAGAAEVLGSLSLAASPLVLGTGLFLVLNPWVNPVAWALPVTAFVNALMALPFALRVLIPASVEAHRRWDRLSESLDLPFGTRLRHVILPRLRRPIGFALGLAAALSIGDLGVVALFTDPAQATLPLAMYGLMDAYRSQAAAAAGLLLLALAFGAYLLFDRGIGGGGD